MFNLEEFVASPSVEKLTSLTKKEWTQLASHFEIEICPYFLALHIRSLVLEVFVEEEEFFDEDEVIKAFPSYKKSLEIAKIYLETEKVKLEIQALKSHLKGLDTPVSSSVLSTTPVLPSLNSLAETKESVSKEKEFESQTRLINSEQIFKPSPLSPITVNYAHNLPEPNHVLIPVQDVVRALIDFFSQFGLHTTRQIDQTHEMCRQNVAQGLTIRLHFALSSVKDLEYGLLCFIFKVREAYSILFCIVRAGVAALPSSSLSHYITYAAPMLSILFIVYKFTEKMQSLSVIPTAGVAPCPQEIDVQWPLEMNSYPSCSQWASPSGPVPELGGNFNSSALPWKDNLDVIILEHTVEESYQTSPTRRSRPIFPFTPPLLPVSIRRPEDMPGVWANWDIFMGLSGPEEVSFLGLQMLLAPTASVLHPCMQLLGIIPAVITEEVADCTPVTCGLGHTLPPATARGNLAVRYPHACNHELHFKKTSRWVNEGLRAFCSLKGPKANTPALQALQSPGFYSTKTGYDPVGVG